jgi:hypothetical protein
VRFHLRSVHENGRRNLASQQTQVLVSSCDSQERQSGVCALISRLQPVHSPRSSTCSLQSSLRRSHFQSRVRSGSSLNGGAHTVVFYSVRSRRRSSPLPTRPGALRATSTPSKSSRGPGVDERRVPARLLVRFHLLEFERVQQCVVESPASTSQGAVTPLVHLGVRSRIAAGCSDRVGQSFCSDS